MKLLCSSFFGVDKSLQKIQSVFSQISSLKACYVYFIIENATLAEFQQSSLQNILQASPILVEDFPKSFLFVIPRFGTTSPWASKATDILKVCGLTNIERIERGIIYSFSNDLDQAQLLQLAPLLHDRMTESVCFDLSDINNLFLQGAPKPLVNIELNEMALQQANKNLGLALNDVEVNYLVKEFQKLNRDPSDVELMMFGQINSEHCRHKIFNARWKIDGVEQPHSLFDMIKNTHRKNPTNVLSAYVDNAAVLQGAISQRFFVDAHTKQYTYSSEPIHTVIKVETHNHPTAIAPFFGAATGAGGEIRDEGATGIGAKPKAGLVGFSVSHLHIPELHQPWEYNAAKPAHMASALEIMLEGPIGAASFNNEFGRPNLCGYFRTFQWQQDKDITRGFHKPIMIAGGIGNIRTQHVEKRNLPIDTKLIVLGGPAMRIGLGGGAASSLSAGTSNTELDFASVQRSNPEMQRRCQEVIDACWMCGDANPILSIHDVGAGGLANALPELVHGSERGGKFSLRDIPNDESDMSPLEIWCNESQERYVLAIAEKDLELFNQIAQRERCPYAVVGKVTADQHLVLQDTHFENKPIQLPLAVLFAKPPKMLRDVQRITAQGDTFDTQSINLLEAAKRVLQFPAVASKSFLITIGDRSVTGLVARDQMVGPWQIPVADVAVTASSFQDYYGEAMAMGERSPVALLNPVAAARLAVAEAVTNIAAANISDISQIRLSANWMAAAGFAGEDAALYEAVQTVGLEFCPALGICIPVGKDSLSMRTVWQQDNKKHEVVAPLSLIVSAFAPVNDIRKTLTPQLINDVGETILILIDLGQGKNYLGGSILAQCYQRLGQQTPDIENPALLKNFFSAIQALNQQDLLLAYHDRSDGGLFATICEMTFAGHVGVSLTIDALGDDPIASLFSESIGAVIQIKKSQLEQAKQILQKFDLQECVHVLGNLNNADNIVIQYKNKFLLEQSRITLQQWWSETSFRMQGLRDNPQCAAEEFAMIAEKNDPGLNVHLSFVYPQEISTPFISKNIKPKIAILREQGVNGHIEMAAVFTQVGFDCFDVHMTDIISGKVALKEFVGLVACGGFSYGDVLGAGRGWAQSILLNSRAHDEFATFFARNNTFALGVCNGCQMLSQLTELIPGSEHWPHFVRNTSEQFEARFSLVEITASPSIFFQGMAGSRLPIAVAHGEGHVEFANQQQMQHVMNENLLALRFVDNHGHVTEKYPANPNGSAQGMTGFTTRDGRVTILMPHPERVFRTVQNSWHPKDWSEHSPWLQMFMNAKKWVLDN
jgi:phosphoribosylformylglycinamidine synthase